MAFFLETLLKLHIETAGNGMFQVEKWVLSNTVTVGVSEFHCDDTATNAIAVIIAIITTIIQNIFSPRVVLERVI